MTDIVRRGGHMTLGSRLKRLGERMQGDVARFMEEVGIGGQPSVPPLLAALEGKDSLTINELVEAVGISQPGVTRSIGQLERAGLVEIRRTQNDRRSKAVALTQKGRDLVGRCREELWPYIEAAVADVCAGLDGPLLNQLAAIEEALAEKPLDRRAAEMRAMERDDA
jgi:DNA-binding MarR family transcriptional regulator